MSTAMKEHKRRNIEKQQRKLNVKNGEREKFNYTSLHVNVDIVICLEHLT